MAGVPTALTTLAVTLSWLLVGRETAGSLRLTTADRLYAVAWPLTLAVEDSLAPA